MLRLIAISFKQHISFADSIGFRVDFLTEQVNGYLFPASFRKGQKSVLRNGEHTARATGSVIAGIGGIFNLVSNRHKDKVCH